MSESEVEGPSLFEDLVSVKRGKNVRKEDVNFVF